jgi:signal transduction histidine kinase/DNA-binding response OmpR family regulator
VLLKSDVSDGGASSSVPEFLSGGGELGTLMRAHDWSSTQLGPPAEWPQSLRMAVRIMLTSLQPIWIGWGPDLIYLYNDPYKSIIGGKHPWALGRPTKQVWREIWADIQPLLQTALGGERGTFVESQLLIMERNGYPEETYYTFSYSPIPDDQGRVGGIFCANSDDTARVIGERQLSLLRELAASTAAVRTWTEACAQSAQALASNQHDLPFALLYVGNRGDSAVSLVESSGIATAHPAVPPLIGLTDASPWPIAGVLRTHETAIIDVPPRLSETLPTGAWQKPPSKAAILPVSAAGEMGRFGVLIAGLNPYRLVDENYRGFLGLGAGQIAAALSSAQAYEDERRRAEALAELDRAKTTFFSNVSHEFRTPLTLMLGPIEDMLAEAASRSEEERERLSAVHRNGMRLLRLVNSLLDFSRIEAGRMQASFEPTDLVEFSREIAGIFRSAIEKAGLRLVVETETLPADVHLDRDMWEKILINLFSNAFKFTHEGEIRLSIRAGDDRSHAVLTLSDTGIGIPEDELPRLFERFHRIEGAKGRSIEGTGIGLALVQELVKLHGGTIEAASEVGSGTAFTLRIPFGTGHLATEHVRKGPRRHRPLALSEQEMRLMPGMQAEEGPATAKGEGEPLAASPVDGPLPGTGKRIVLADDNMEMRDYVARLLAAQGYSVERVPDGEAALSAVRRERPDLLLTDVMMPKVDGLGVLRAIREDKTLATLPVLMLSARAGEEAKVEGLAAQADDYLAKPFTAKELVARVNSNIQLSAFRRRIIEAENRYVISQERLTRALSTGRVAVYDWEVDSDRLSILGPLAEVFGVRAETAAEGLPLDQFLEGILAEDREATVAAVQRTVRTGAPFDVEYRVAGAGQVRTVVSRGNIEARPSGHRQFSGVLIDVTDEKAVQRELRQKTTALQILNDTSAAISGNLDLKAIVQSITDAGVKLVGAEFGAFFYNVRDEAGDRYMLYTLSGAPYEAFSSFAMPRNTAIFSPTFNGEGIVRSDDIRRDPRYGHNAPYRGMPPGHLAVRSYLAVPVKGRTGEVLGGLFFGHSRPGIFGMETEDLVLGLSAQAAVAMENATLFQTVQRELASRQKAEADLHEINATLEQRVADEVSRRAAAEDALRQAQKMEAIGQLTGGVAHDFNNLLTIIMGGLESIRRARPEDHGRITRAAEMALQGTQRAASLTGRLLAFSRRQPLDPRPLDLNLLVREMTELLHRSLGEHIELEGIMAPRLWTVEVDKNQLESAILNLAVNARDAMPDGGKLTIETANTALDETYTQTDREVIPGQYVMLSVSDNGTGMPSETLERAFEPFFTTKEVGKGTGLGLSMVYGFAKQSGGHVTIYSEPTQGTTVKLYFPRFVSEYGAVQPVSERKVPGASRRETVLVVEDNDDVRNYSGSVLRELGYHVLEAGHPDEAELILRSESRIDLLFTDIVLPGRSGRALAETAKRIRPGIRVLYTTGYSKNAIVHHGRLDADVSLIGKPFTFGQLAAKVRDVLDRSC